MTAHATTAVTANLSTAFLINEAVFLDHTTKQKTDIIASIPTGKPVKFLPNFETIASKKELLNRLLTGQDINLMAEFQGIELSDEEKAAIEAFKPLVTRLNLEAKEYEWEPQTATVGIRWTNTHVIKEGRQVTLRAARSLWDKASLYWSGGPQPTPHRIDETRVGSSWDRTQHRAVYSRQQVAIGCQRIRRSDIEALAKAKGWPPIVFRG